mmetsp:Transcript_42029/g.70123  ORF Transcript_42029/g.70123 Transcript_42029/m.70123 type:complete len:203 (+) Transcript_42029:358-966(+)
MVLVCHLVLVASKPPPAPYIALPQPRQGLLQHRVAAQRGGGVAILKPPVINGHYLGPFTHQTRCHRALDGIHHHLRPRARSAAQFRRVLVHGLHVTLAHLEHERVVRARLGVGVGVGVVADPSVEAPEAQGGELRVRSGAVLLRVVREDGGAVERAVVLRKVKPALGAMRVSSADAEADDVTVGIRQAVRPLRLAHHPKQAV